MKTRNRILAVTSAALLLGVAFMPAHAIDLNVAGIGISANTGGGSVASAGVTSDPSGGQGFNLAVNDTSGELVELDQDGNDTNGAVNLGLDGLGLGDLGGLGGLDGVIPGDGSGGGTFTSTDIAASFAALTGGEQVALRSRCRAVLANPGAFEASLVALCRVIARIGPTG